MAFDHSLYSFKFEIHINHLPLWGGEGKLLDMLFDVRYSGTSGYVKVSLCSILLEEFSFIYLPLSQVALNTCMQFLYCCLLFVL